MDWSEELKQISASIPAAVMEWAQRYAISHTFFCTYLQEYKGEIIFRTFGYHDTKRDGFEITEVLRMTPAWPKWCIEKNLLCSNMGGYKAIYSAKPHKRTQYGYVYGYWEESLFDKWYTDIIPYPAMDIINIDALTKCQKYKYCGYLNNGNLFNYLVLYNKHPQTEYLGKLGLPASKILLDLAKKDKQFIHYLQENSLELRHYRPRTIIYAYKNKITPYEAQNALYVYNRVCRDVCDCVPEVKKTNIDRIRLNDYLDENDISAYCYNDYLRAIKYLGMDLNDTKNIFPYDFQRMHDLRIAEKASREAKENEAKHKELYEKFAKVAIECQQYAFAGDKYEIIIPNSVNDLINEGNALQHCVGRMGYDSKMAAGKCIIAFVRLKSEKEKPLVTVEWLTGKKIVSQCYAKNDSKPEAEIKEFVNEWENWMINKSKEKVA